MMNLALRMKHELHWLPIKKRVIYKLPLMVYKSQHDTVPDYITAHLLNYTPSRLLRSSEDRLWNAAPFQLKSIQNIDSFKSKLKTYLFMLNL